MACASEGHRDSAMRAHRGVSFVVRSQKDGFTWDSMTKLADDWLPAPRILHPRPDQRFAVKHSR